MSGFALVFRALITGPARRHPIRVLLPAIGVAIGVAAVAAIHHANRSVTASFQDAAAAVSGRSDFVVTGAAGIRVEALEALAFLWPIGTFAPAVSGSAVIDDGSREVAQVLGVDWGGDGAVRDVRLVDPAGTAARAALLAESGSVFVSVPFAGRHHLAPGAELVARRGRRAPPRADRRNPGALRPGAGLRRRHPRHRHFHGPGPARKEGPRRPRGHRARSGRVAGRRRARDRAAAAAGPRARAARARRRRRRTGWSAPSA